MRKEPCAQDDPLGSRPDWYSSSWAHSVGTKADERVAKMWTRLVSVFLGTLLSVSLSHASLQSVPINCGGSQRLWLWVDASSPTCAQNGSFWECSDSSDGDFVKGNCAQGCHTVTIGNLSGCFRGTTADTPPYAVSNHTVSCPNQRQFDLTGKEGDTCTTSKNSQGEVVGGSCKQTVENVETVSTSATCEDGCETSSPPADCKER